MATFAARRQENIKQNQSLFEDLGLPSKDNGARPAESKARASGVKRKAAVVTAPTRSSRRIAESATKPIYNEAEAEAPISSRRVVKKTSRDSRATKHASSESDDDVDSKKKASIADAASIVAGWTEWKPEAPEPTRDEDGTFHFESHPDFRPNKSPDEIMREGSFGGSYWRPLYSKRLGITVRDDWKELPESWTTGLDIDTFLTNSSYDPEVNKYGVACGQSIEEWEAAGWIAHEYDVRGWFQWYCRFWMGRRCPDDERQVSRWKKCVGETGRWRRILLKKYVALGIRSVLDDGDEDGVGDVSPVVHQTCHHWAYEVRQEALERFWATGK